MRPTGSAVSETNNDGQPEQYESKDLEFRVIRIPPEAYTFHHEKGQQLRE